MSIKRELNYILLGTYIKYISVTLAELIARVRFSCFLKIEIFPFFALLIALGSIVSGTAILISSLEKREKDNVYYKIISSECPY